MTLAEIEVMDRPTLIRAWTGLFGREVPKGLSSPMLRRILATELQTRQHGGPSKRVLRILEQDCATPGPSNPRLKPGGRLLREWNGVTHVVEVTAAGYLWNGARYRSLSAIAQAITGAHWSGPRFFGLGAAGAK